MKACEGCQRSFKAGSNRAKWCPDCKTGRVQASNDRYNAKRDGRSPAHGPVQILSTDGTNEGTRVRFKAETNAADLLTWYRLVNELYYSASGRKILQRCGVDVSVLGTCDITGTPTVGVSPLTVDLVTAYFHLKELYQAR